MKWLSFLLFSIYGLTAVMATTDGSCYNDVIVGCSWGPSSDLELPSCTANYGGWGLRQNLATELEAYATLHLQRSFEYLLSSVYFNNYEVQRPGFSKLFRKLSDDAWEKSIQLIHHLTLRGGVMDFSHHGQRPDVATNRTYLADQTEIYALAQALDTQKEMAERAFEIHGEAVRMDKTLHDAEIEQFMEEEFTQHQSKFIRELAGYLTDLKSFMSDQQSYDVTLSLYLFDEYLLKTV